MEGVKVYDNTTLRLIQAGVKDLVQPGPFIAIFPRSFHGQEEASEHYNAIGKGEARPALDLGHFTLVSNIHCEANKVNVWVFCERHLIYSREVNEKLNIIHVFPNWEKV